MSAPTHAYIGFRKGTSLPVATSVPYGSSLQDLLTRNKLPFNPQTRYFVKMCFNGEKEVLNVSLDQFYVFTNKEPLIVYID